MNENVIRKDIIEIEVKSTGKGLNELNEGLEKLKKSANGGVDDGLDKIKKSADNVGNSKGINEINDDLEKLKKSVNGGVDDKLDKIKKSADNVGKSKGLEKLKDSCNKIKGSLEKAKDKAQTFGTKIKEVAKTNLNKLKSSLQGVKIKLNEIAKKAVSSAYNGLKKIAGMSFKALAAGIGAAATAIGAVVKQSVAAYGEFEQLKGGMEKIFDQADTVQIMTDANNAYKDLGMSANDYLRMINDTGANFASTMGDQAGYDAAKKGMTAISDYATGTGKDISLLSEKFTMITRASSSYQSIADQFSGILPATSADFLKQATAAGFLTKGYKKLTDVPIAEYQSAVASMLELGVENLNLTGNTAYEATKTLTGSMGMMKSAWGNLLTAMAGGGDLDQCIDNMVDSVSTFGEQALPLVENALGGIGVLIDRLVPEIAKELPKYIDSLLPPLINASVELVAGLIRATPQIVSVIVKQLPDIIRTISDAISDTFGVEFSIGDRIADFFTKNGSSIKSGVKVLAPILIGAFASLKIGKKIAPLLSLFGKKGKGGRKKKGGIFKRITDMFKELAKVNTKTILQGMAKLTIIVAGITLLTTIFMWLAPKIMKLGDPKSLLAVVGLTLALGVVGTALAKLSQIVGKIKVSTVALGLANMAIMLTGIGALLFIITKVFSAKIDTKQMFGVIALIGVLGAVGTVLSVFASIVGLIPVSTVALGLANISIILVGIGTLLLVLTKVFQKGINFKELLQVITLIGILCTVGAILSVFAGIVGLIPVPVVALGLANISIILVGIGALLLVLNKAFENGVNFKELLQVITLIGILGTVGSVLSVFAGIVGMIPIPVVLAGLTNIGLVLGGITALIVAFGKLTEVKGFTTFIEKGGEVLVKIFNIIGKMAGSLVGGLGESLTESLPKIGQNLAKFAKSISPMFVMFKGADMQGIGSFFKSFGAFMLQMAGEKLLSFFTGKTDFAGLGTELSTFATNATDFFTTVATFPENSFENAKKLFSCLAGMKSLPKEGGVVSWFTGSMNFESLANGLKILAGKRVTKFFNTVAEFKEAGFENAKKLFNTLAGLKSLPKEGGIVGWFSGKINFENIADGLGSLASKKMKSFFTMMNELEAKTFSNIKSLFNALASMKKVPKEGGIFSKAKGEVNFADIGTQLSNFATNSQGFLTFVNTLNVETMVALFDALKKLSGIVRNLQTAISSEFTEMKNIVKISCDNVITTVKNTTTSVKNTIAKTDLSSGGKLMMNSWISGINSRASAVVSAVAKIANSINSKINGTIKGANWALQEFGSSKRLTTYKYANGTNGHRGGNAIVNDGRGAEMVQMPNGNTFIPKGRNVFMPNAPKGMKVLPAEQTAQVLGKKSPTFHYAKGTGDIDVWDYIDNTGGLVDKLNSKYINYADLARGGLYMAQSAVATASTAMKTFLKKAMDEFGALSLSAYNPSKGVEQWRSTVIRALKMEGLYSEANVRRTLFQMQTESGGNPRAINLWDINAKNGVPSKGLMQVIDPTFAAYARPGFDKNIYDPLSNILASIRYARARYGSLERAYRGVGYANGGFANKPSIFGESGLEVAIPFSRDKRDRAISLWAKTGEMLGLSRYSPESTAESYSSTTVTEYNTYSPQFNLTISGTSDDRTMARKVKKWVKESIDETFDSFSSKNPKLREV